MQRLEVRLEPELHAQLRRLSEERHRSMSSVIRLLIEEAYAELERADRIRAAEELGSMEAFDLGTPEELEAEIEAMYDHPHFH